MYLGWWNYIRINVVCDSLVHRILFFIFRGVMLLCYFTSHKIEFYIIAFLVQWFVPFGISSRLTHATFCNYKRPKLYGVTLVFIFSCNPLYYSFESSMRSDTFYLIPLSACVRLISLSISRPTFAPGDIS